MVESNGTVPTDKYWSAGYIERPQTIALDSTLIVLEVILTFLWLCARRLSQVSFMLSDILIPLSLFVNLGMCTCILVLFHWIPSNANVPQDRDQSLPRIIVYYVIAVLYVGGVTFSRLSILDLHHHIFIDKITRYAIYITGAAIGVAWFANTVAIIAQCQPIHQLWDPVPGGTCNNIRDHYSWGILPNMVANIILLLIPIPTIYRLRTTWQRKLGIFFIFFIGVLGLTASIFCFVMFTEYRTKKDTVFNVTSLMAWTVIEPAIYHIAACMITLGPVVKWIFSKPPLSTWRSRGGRKDDFIYRTDTNETSKTIRSKTLSKFNCGENSMDDDQCSIFFVPRDRGFSECSASADMDNHKYKNLESYIMVEHGFEVQSESSTKSKPSNLSLND